MSMERVIKILEQTRKDMRDDLADMPDVNSYAAGYCHGSIEALQEAIDLIRGQE